tara:strand:- start:125 stop:469 length:345 start_codon:yes stop_codon:yes gene_type:complete
MATPIKWEDADFKWELAPTDTGESRYTWDDVALVEEVVEAIETIQQGGGVIEDDMPWMKNQDKKKRLIKLILKCQGKTYKETKEIQNIKITAKDIKLLAEKVLGIEVLTENVKF